MGVLPPSSYLLVLHFLYQSIRWLYCAHKLQLVSPLHSCSIVFFSVCKQDPGTYPSFHFFFFSILHCGHPVQQSSKFGKFSFFCCWLLYGPVVEIRRSVYILKSQRILCVSFSRRDAWLCIYDLFVEFKVLAQFPVDSPCPPSRVYSYRLSVLISHIRLLCNWWFRLNHYITCIYCFVASYQSSLWYDWPLWRCFVQLLEEIQFLF